jgi:hypothetical protein
MEQPPVRFAAGRDALGKVLEMAEAILSEAEALRELASSTDGQF